MAEQKIQASILSALKERGAYCVKVMAANRNGVPDIIACYKGQFVAIEVKDKYGRPTPLQQANIQQIRKADGWAIVAWSVDEALSVLEEIDETLQTSSNSG